MEHFNSTGICVFLVLFLFACKQENREKSFLGYDNKFGEKQSINEISIDSSDFHVVKVPKNTDKNAIDMSKVITVEKIVQLETNENCLINTIHNLFFIDDYLVVIDKLGSKAFIFNEDGKFISQVGKVGHGPGEYASIDASSINDQDSTILLMDSSTRKMRFYDLNGNFIRSKGLLYFAEELSFLKNGNVVLEQYDDINIHLPDGGADYQILFADSTQKITGKAFSYYTDRYKPELLIHHNTPNFYQLNQSVYFTPLYTNEVYTMTEANSIQLKYRLDLGNKDILNNLSNYSTIEESLKALNVHRKWAFRGVVVENDKYLFAKVDNAGILFYNKETHSVISGSHFILKMSKYEEGAKEERIIYPDILETKTVHNNNFVSIVQPPDINSGEQSVKFDNLANEVEIYDNPILVFYSVNKKAFE